MFICVMTHGESGRCIFSPARAREILGEVERAVSGWMFEIEIQRIGFLGDLQGEGRFADLPRPEHRHSRELIEQINGMGFQKAREDPCNMRS